MSYKCQNVGICTGSADLGQTDTCQTCGGPVFPSSVKMNNEGLQQEEKLFDADGHYTTLTRIFFRHYPLRTHENHPVFQLTNINGELELFYFDDDGDMIVYDPPDLTIVKINSRG